MVKKAIKQQIAEKTLYFPPVVAILGHVDHGKTTLLDNIRKSNVAERESGGITQHIAAYQISHKGKKITFIDTPGHEAFSQIRARGAKVTDIAILMVAADDGVMPQTKESIAHIKTASVPYLIAINKIDLQNSNVEKVKKQLAQEGVLVEGYGGDIVAVQISAKTGKGVDELLEMVQLVAEVAEVGKNTISDFEGVIIESYIDKFRGPIAKIIVKSGSLKVGDLVFGDTTSGKIKSLVSPEGESVKEAVVSDPVEILGLEKVPQVGDTLSKKLKEKSASKETKSRLERDWEASAKTSEVRLIIKADTYGSLEAISSSIESLKKEDQEVKFVHKETGDITENDILLAAASKSIVIGFNVKISNSLEKLAEEESVNIRTYKLIYELLDELKEGLDALAESKKKKDVLGEAKILSKFEIEEGIIAGAKVLKGRINKSDNIEVLRGDKVLKETKIRSMKHKQSDINESGEGKEFGVIFEDKIKFEPGDIIQAVKD